MGICFKIVKCMKMNNLPRPFLKCARSKLSPRSVTNIAPHPVCLQYLENLLKNSWRCFVCGNNSVSDGHFHPFLPNWQKYLSCNVALWLDNLICIYLQMRCALGDILMPKVPWIWKQCTGKKNLIVISCSFRRQVLVFAISKAKKKTNIYEYRSIYWNWCNRFDVFEIENKVRVIWIQDRIAQVSSHGDL